MTGVQTCALPISKMDLPEGKFDAFKWDLGPRNDQGLPGIWEVKLVDAYRKTFGGEIIGGLEGMGFSRDLTRSEERRVGKECRSRWSPEH